MNTTKLRRSLISLCIFSVFLWVVGSFVLMVIWYAKGGVSVPTSRPVSISEYQALVGWLKAMVFNIIPGIAAGYLVIALMVLDLIVKTKPAKESESKP